MKKAELIEAIADLEEKAERQKLDITGDLHELKVSLKPLNIVKHAASGLVSKLRSVFQIRKDRKKAS